MLYQKQIKMSLSLPEMRKTFKSFNGRKQLCNLATEYRDLIIDSGNFTLPDILEIVEMFAISNVGWESNALEMFLHKDILNLHGINEKRSDNYVHISQVARLLQCFIDKALDRHIRVFLDKVHHLFLVNDSNVSFIVPTHYASNTIKKHFIRWNLGNLLAQCE